MEKLCFADGDKIGVFDGERTELFESEYILRYREYAEMRNKNDEWKFGGEGARFRGDYERYQMRREEKVYASVNGVQWKDGKVVYSFTVNGSSGVYCKDVCDKKAREEHIISSSDEEFLSLHRGGNTLAVTVGKRDGTSCVGLLNMETSELRTLTEGDSRDANPYFSPDTNLIYFDSAGVGRDGEGNFTGEFSPAAILTLDAVSLELKEVKQDKKFACVKPKIAQNGDLYYIKRPNKPKKRGNLFLDILLFPFRILKAIFGFLQAFVMIFGHTSLNSAAEGGDNPTRGRKTDGRRLFLDGSYIETEKELKRNRKAKEKEAGFIPLTWKLVRFAGGQETVIKGGVCDFALCADGGIYCTNGRHIFYLNGTACRKVADAESCVSIATESAAAPPDELFAL